MLKRVIPMLAVLMLVAACGLQYVTKEQTPVVAYTAARVAFNNHLSSYLAFRDVMPSGAEKDAMRANYEPKFEKAKGYLDAWKAVLGSPSAEEKQRLFNTLFDSMVIELINSGIIQTVKGG